MAKAARVRSLLTALILALLATLAWTPVRTPAADGTGLKRGQRIALIVLNDSHPRADMAIDDLTSFLQRSLQAVVRRYPGNVSLKELDEDAYLLFGPADDSPDLSRLARDTGVALATRDLGPEASLIKSASVAGKPVVFLTGKTLTGACYAAYSFLENELGIGFFIDGDRVPELQSVELSGLERIETPAVPIRGIFYHPTWKHPHATSWRLWSWEGSRKYIDWMRRKRFNVLPAFHDEGGYFWGDVIFKTFPRLKINDKSLAQYVVDPSWRTQLNKKMFRYARDSGIQIAYNLFYSQVPEFFADAYPELKYHPLNMRNVGISAIQPQCKEIMKKYWGALLETYGIDDSHLYLVCSYQHERSLPPYYQDRNAPTIQAHELVKELDPKAKMFIETWCWKYRHECPDPYSPCPGRNEETLTAYPKQEWEIFNKGVPREIGVVEWDLKTNSKRLPDLSFGGRPYIQLTHTNMEGWWPPTTARRSPRWLIKYFDEAIDHGAQGVMFFHIQATANEISADLAARIGLQKRPDLAKFYRDYARRRFGEEVADTLAESLAHLCDSVEMGADNSAPFNLSLALVFPGFNASAEDLLAKCQEVGEARKTWIRDRLKVFEEKEKHAGRAQLLARSAAPRLKEDPFFKRHIWELDYVSARFEGIENMYKAHLYADSDPAKAAAHFRRATDAFTSVKELFRDKPGHRMSEIRNLEPDVPYTAAFLKDWETRGYWQPIVKWFHVVWERLDEFEARIQAMKPKGLAE
jgi:hypothetical protein